MDAVTSLELEAQRRRETLAVDRDHASPRGARSPEGVIARIVEPRPPRNEPLVAPADRPSGTLARNAVG
jgi:hypothetical protein